MLPIATSKGQIVPEYSDEVEDYICRLMLDEHRLIVEREEYSKENICLYDIPLENIIEFDFINRRQQNNSILKSFWLNFVGVFAFALSGSGFIEYKSEAAPDIVMLSFYDNSGKTVELVFDMMEFGEGGLTKKYKKLINT